MRSLPMHHVAIMNSKNDLFYRLKTRQKTIESRWSKHRITPFQKVYAGDTVFFKLSGQPVTLKTIVKKVEFHQNLDKAKVTDLINQHAKGLGLKPYEIKKFIDQQQYKKYVTLIWLQYMQPITPFEIDKTGFGAQAAWITLPDIKQIRQKMS